MQTVKKTPSSQTRKRTPWWLFRGLILLWLVAWLVAPVGFFGSLFATAAGILPTLAIAAPGFLACLVIAGQAIRRKTWLPSAVWFGCILGVSLAVLDVRWSPPGTAKPDAIRMMTFNVFYRSHEVPHVADYIRENKLDILVLQENKAGPRSPVTSLRAEFPEWHITEAGEVAIISRWRLSDIQEHPLRSLQGREILSATVHGPQKFRMVTVHWSSVQIKQGWKGLVKARDRAALDSTDTARVLETEDRLPTILAGDFNAVARHPGFRKLPGWQNCFNAKGRGLGWTFSTAHPLVRIDHIFVNHGFEPVDCWVGPDLGSDHLPLLAVLNFTSEPR